MRNYTRGKPLTPGEKQFIVHLKHYFDRNKKCFGVRDLSAQMVADALEVGLSTVNRIMADFKKDPESIHNVAEPRGRPSYAIEETNQERIRAFIRKANLEGKHINLETIRDMILENDPNSAFHIATLARSLDRWGFEFGQGVRTQRYKEKDHVVAARALYLRRILRNRNQSKSGTLRPEVYLDESYVNKNHSNDWVWYSSEDGPWIQKPTGKGERLIIVNAITQDGWVPGAQLVFKSSKKTGDYHGQMNWELFKKWFLERLLPNIPDESVIVMDNAPYHNALSADSPPTQRSAKSKIKEWLEASGFPFKENCLKAELVKVLAKTSADPIYEIDRIATEQGHEVLRTPPYHPELQPIEVCWGVVKNEIGRNCDFTVKGLQKQIENAFSKVTATTCRKIIARIRKTEDQFWKEDAELDDILERL